jgi:sugar/nucleoside kinase (ribokinase family)
LNYQLEIARYAKANGVKLCFQPGTYQISAGAETLKEVYEATELFVCNKEEAQQILKSKETDEKTLMEGIRALGPKVVVITDGTNGANLLDTTGAWHVPMYPDPKPPISRTGAGDASASTTAAFIHLGLSPIEALLHGEINSMNVVQHVGAQAGLLSRDEIENWYAKRPVNFAPAKL